MGVQLDLTNCQDCLHSWLGCIESYKQNTDHLAEKRHTDKNKWMKFDV